MKEYFKDENLKENLDYLIMPYYDFITLPSMDNLAMVMVTDTCIKKKMRNYVNAVLNNKEFDISTIED